jgi:acylphosphatase
VRPRRDRHDPGDATPRIGLAQNPIEPARTVTACGVRALHARYEATHETPWHPGNDVQYRSLCMRIARRFLVSGRVTGVGFRYFAHDAAGREGLTGVVRNLPDGRVEAIAEGDAEAVERFEAALRRGPARARVEHVEVEAVPVSGRYLGFAIE